MEDTARIHAEIQAYYGGMTGAHHRYRSWEHCYRYFHRSTPEHVAADHDHAALQEWPPGADTFECGATESASLDRATRRHDSTRQTCIRRLHDHLSGLACR
jgi:hypothetical protein